MSVEAMVQTMIDDLTAALGDAVKHDKGNAAAGTRVRKAMQAAKAAAQDCAQRSKLTRTLEAQLRVNTRHSPPPLRRSASPVDSTTHPVGTLPTSGESTSTVT